MIQLINYKEQKSFFRLDLRSIYHLLKIKPEDVSKSAFRTKHGQYESTMKPYGLANRTTAFMDHMNRVSNPFGQVVMVFIHDILI